ncbi:MAG: diacylglycerol kinase family lipid kinase [Myxococcales bacterium]|nr:diacylglycerol kinase family lipid kinase [Myxococcales bacterium]
MKIFVCVNPASAAGRTGKRWPEIAAAIRSRLGDFESAFTQTSREAGKLVRQALLGGADLIVSVGGDGTHNEVVQGFFTDEHTPTPVRPGATLAIVPTGTGGDLRRTLGLPRDPLEAIKLLADRKRIVDVGHLEFTRHDGGPGAAYFINVCSFGMSGLVDKIVNESSKAFGGRLSFLLGVGQASLKYKNQGVRLRLDGGEWLTRTVNNVAIANARYYGGGMMIAPDADPGDGLFDVVIVGDVGTFEMVAALGPLYSGKHVGRDKIEVYRARRIEAVPASAGEVVLIDLDGEQPGRLPGILTVIPGALKICVGPNVADDVVCDADA